MAAQRYISMVIPSGAQILGVYKTEIYVAHYDGSVWKWDGAAWWFVAAAEEWPTTSIAAALNQSHEQGAAA